MGMSAGHDGGPRQDVNLASTRGAFRGTNRAETMPQMHYEEFREGVDGMTIELKRKGSIHIDPINTPTNLVNVVFASDVTEQSAGHVVNLKIIATDQARPGVAFRLDPDEICLIQKFDEPNQHDVRISPKWNSRMGYLEFESLRFGSRYILAFTSAGAGDPAEVVLPGVPDGLSATTR